MPLESPEDVMPWVGLYVAVASLVCTLAMAADVLRGFWQWKLWFPNRFFTLNAASVTLIAIAMKLPVDLNSDTDDNVYVAKISSIFFLFTMLANFLPSLGLMDDKQLLVNMVAFTILIITIVVNLWIQLLIPVSGTFSLIFLASLFTLPPLWVFSVALTVTTSRKILQHQYKELHKLASNEQEINFSYKELVHKVKKYWMMAETGNPQFVIACSQVSSTFGVICPLIAFFSITLLFESEDPQDRQSNYRWSSKVISTVQLIGVTVGSIAPTLRCLTSISYFNISAKWSKNHLNVFRVEKQWIQRLQQWKRSHVNSHIPGRHCKIVFHSLKNMILNFCIGVQVMVVVMSNIICLVPRSLLILFSCCWYICKLMLKRFTKESNVSEIEEYARYVLQIEGDAKLSKRILESTLKSITRFIHASEKKMPINLMKLLRKSTGFNGVVEFDENQVPHLNSEEPQNSWSLVIVTLTAIAVALPNVATEHVKGLLLSMSEGLQIVKHVEKSLNKNDELVNARKASRRLGTEVEVYRTWLGINLQNKSRKGITSKEILQRLCDEAIKIVIQSKNSKNRSLDHSFHEFISANSMYRISQTVLLHCNKQEVWPRDEEVFEWVSTITADIFFACFTNLPRVITMKCHHDAIEKRQDSIRSAAQVLGKSKEIIEILKARQLPNLDTDSMAYLDKWHALQNNQTPKAHASTSSNESVIVTIM